MPKFIGDILKYSGPHHFTLYRDVGSESKVSGSKIVPESQEWFLWIAYVSSFIYIGNAGTYEVRKKFQDGRQDWYAYQNIRGNRTELHLGNSRELSIARLEQVALEFKQMSLELKPVDSELKQTRPAIDFTKNIFISYSRAEFYFAESLSHELNKRGVGTWFDVAELVPGTSWQQNLREGLDTCQGLILIASRTALKSAYVRNEWQTALAAHKPIYVVLFEAVQLPPELQSAHILDFRDRFDTKVVQLASLINSGSAPRDRLPGGASFSLRRQLPPGAMGVISGLWVSLLTFVLWTSLLMNIASISLVRPAALPAVMMFGLTWLACIGYTCYLLVGFTYRRRISYTALSLWLIVPPLLIVPGLFVLVLNFGTVTAFFGIATVVGPSEARFPVVGGNWETLVFTFSLLSMSYAFAFFGLRRSKGVMRWLATGTASEKLRSPLQQIYRGEAPDEAVKTYRLHYAPEDERLVSRVRFVLGTGEYLTSSSVEQADFHIAVLTNQTSQEWLDQLVQTYPNLICIVATSIRLPAEERVVRELQWIDYRSGSSASLERLVFFLTRGKVGMWAMKHPVVPESLERLVVPRQVRIISQTLLILAMLNLTVGGATTIALIRQGPGHAALGTWPIISIVIAGVLFWLANRLMNRCISFVMLLISVILALASMPLLGTMQDLFNLFDWFGPLAWISIPLVIGLLSSPLLLLLLFQHRLREWLPMVERWRIAKQRRKTLALSTRQGFVLNTGLYVLWSLGLQSLLFTHIVLVLPLPMVVVPAHLALASTEFPIGLSDPAQVTFGGITAGPDGNLWFTTTTPSNSNPSTIPTPANIMTIVRVTPSGSITRFVYNPSLLCEPYSCDDQSFLGGITSGPDGNLWFTANQIFSTYPKLESSLVIGRITPTGTISEFGLSDNESQPGQIIAGPDGNLWFTETDSNKIGKISPAGTITRFPLPTPDSGLSGLTAGPDGNLWFTERRSDNIGRISPAGTITEFLVPTVNSGLSGIATGSDSNLWFTEDMRNVLGRITPAGNITEFKLPDSINVLPNIIEGRDGYLWLPEGDILERITPSGQITEFHLLHAGISNDYTTVGPDGNLWFIDQLGNKIGYISF